MKRYGDLWNKIIDKDNIKLAHKMAKKDKSFYEEVKYVDEHLEEWCSINSYSGWIKWCNGYNLYLKYIKPLEFYTNKYYMEVIKK